VQIFTDFKITHRLSNKPFLIWLLTTPTHLKYVATLPCNLSLMACFAGSNVSQNSVATYMYARCCGILNMHLATHSPRNLPANKIFKSVQICACPWRVATHRQQVEPLLALCRFPGMSHSSLRPRPPLNINALRVKLVSIV